MYSNVSIAQKVLVMIIVRMVGVKIGRRSVFTTAIPAPTATATTAITVAVPAPAAAAAAAGAGASTCAATAAAVGTAATPKLVPLLY